MAEGVADYTANAMEFRKCGVLHQLVSRAVCVFNVYSVQLSTRLLSHQDKARALPFWVEVEAK